MRTRILLLIGLLACGHGFTQETAPDAGKAMPAELAELDLPAQFEWLGTTPKRSRGETTGVMARFRSPLDPDDAREIVQSALRNAGWTIDELMRFHNAPFSFPDLPRNGRACRWDRIISFTAARRQGINEVAFTIPAGTGATPCSFTPDDHQYIDRLRELPVLNAPRSSQTGEYAKPGPSSGFHDSGSYRSATWIRLGASIEEVLSQLAAEMSAQGWSRDTSWTGSHTSGSSWTKRAGGKPVIYASLHVTESVREAADGNLVISFQAFKLASDTGTDAHGDTDARRVMDPLSLNRQIFVDLPAEGVSIVREEPAEGPGFRMPPEFEWYGTATSKTPRPATATALQTSLPLLRARGMLLQSLIDAGWRHESSSGQSETFLVPERAQYDRLCRGTEIAALRVQDIEGVRYATIHWTGITRTTRECYGSRVVDRNLEPAQRSGMPGLNVPRLEFPDSTKPVPGHRINSLSNGIQIFNADRIRSSDTPAGIAQHLAPQLSAQGWQREVAWSGQRSAGSSWLLREDGKPPIWGELEIVDLGAGLLDVRFDLKAER